MKNKKVLLVGPSMDAKGGVALYYSIVYPLLKQSDNINVDYFPIGSSQGRGFFGDILSFTRKIKDYSPNLVHVNTSLGWKSFLRDGVFLLIAGFFKAKKLVFFRGWSLSDKTTSGRVFQAYFKLCYQSSDAFCVLASDVANRLKGWNIKGRIFRQTTVVDKQLVSKYKKNTFDHSKKSADSIHLLFLSRVERQKGVFELVEALNILNKQGLQCYLTIAGIGSDVSSLKQKVCDLNISHLVNFSGFVSGNEKAELLNKANVFCLPSYTEGMPNAVLEAMCFGMPIITCPTGALKDIVSNEVGVLVPMKSAQAIAAAIKIYFNNQQLEDTAVHNRNKGMSNFLSDKVSSELLSVYEEII